MNIGGNIYRPFGKSKFLDIYLSISFHRHPNKRRYIPGDKNSRKFDSPSLSLWRVFPGSLGRATVTCGSQKNQLSGLCEISAQLRRAIAKSSRAIDGRIIKRSRSALRRFRVAFLSRAPSAFHRACAFLLRVFGAVLPRSVERARIERIAREILFH